MRPTKFQVHWPRGVGGVGFWNNCWRRMTNDRQGTTDIDWSQQLTLSTLCSGELKKVATCIQFIDNSQILDVYTYLSHWWLGNLTSVDIHAVSMSVKILFILYIGMSTDTYIFTNTLGFKSIDM